MNLVRSHHHAYNSDGLWEMVRDRQIAANLTTPVCDPSQKAHALVQAALAGGGVDNISVIVVQVSKLEHLLHTSPF